MWTDVGQAEARRTLGEFEALYDPFVRYAFSIDDAREGYALIRMIVRDDMLNGHRIGHGGMIFALAHCVRLRLQFAQRKHRRAERQHLVSRSGASG